MENENIDWNYIGAGVGGGIGPAHTGLRFHLHSTKQMCLPNHPSLKK